MTHFTQQQIEEMLETLQAGAKKIKTIIEFNDDGTETVTTETGPDIYLAAPELTRQLLDVMAKLQAAEEKLKVAEDALMFYGHVNNHKIWNGEIILLDKGRRANEALAVIRGEEI